MLHLFFDIHLMLDTTTFLVLIEHGRALLSPAFVTTQSNNAKRWKIAQRR